MFAIVSPDLFCHHAVCLGKGGRAPEEEDLGDWMTKEGGRCERGIADISCKVWPSVENVVLVTAFKS